MKKHRIITNYFISLTTKMRKTPHAHEHTYSSQLVVRRTAKKDINCDKYIKKYKHTHAHAKHCTARTRSYRRHSYNNTTQ